MSSEPQTTPLREDRGRNHETDFHDSPRGQSRRVQDGGEATVEAEVYDELGSEEFRRYHETDFHDSPVGQSRRETVVLDGEEWAVDNVVEVERLRREYSNEYQTLMVSTGEPTRRGVVACLVENGPTTYADLSEWTSKTERTVKNHVHALRDENVVEVEEGRPASIGFRNEDLRLLASDALSFLD